MKFTAGDLDAFVRRSDELGGLHSEGVGAYWADFQYVPTVHIDQNLDPYSTAYFEQQIALYREISGRAIDPDTNELYDFGLDSHVREPNPLGVRHMSVAMHYLRLGQALMRSTLPHSPRILDMGAGWGLSSEFLATLGARVTAVDINPMFVDLIQRRQAHNGLDIKAVRGTFDEFEATDQYDAVLFYECLHHAMKPWELIARAATWLAPKGQILFAGEPVGGPWWRHWGLRLDPMSVYCIRKFGWFESGWSKDFITDCFRRAGFMVDYTESNDPVVGPVCVATKIARNVQYAPLQLANMTSVDGCDVDATYITVKGTLIAQLPRPEGADVAEFAISNFRRKPVEIKVTVGNEAPFKVTVLPGATSIRCRLAGKTTRIRFDAPTWVPAKELRNHDRRAISFHIGGVRFSEDTEDLLNRTNGGARVA